MEVSDKLEMEDATRIVRVGNIDRRRDIRAWAA